MTAWYAVQTKPRAEWGVHRDLRDEGYATLYLHYAGTIRHARRVLGVLKPYFPRYLFVEVDRQREQSVGFVNRIRHVHGVVGTPDGPLPIPEPVIAELASRADGNGKVGHLTADQRRLIEAGSQVRILGGPLEGLLAHVALDGGNAIRVWLTMFGGKVEAIFDPAGLEQISPAMRSYPPKRLCEPTKTSTPYRR